MAYNKETGMWEGYIYKIYNDVNDKVYIGQTIQTVYDRFLNHISCTRNENYNTYIYNAMRKYGIDNFHVQELVKIQNGSLENLQIELDQVEMLYVQLYKSMSKQNGYNLDAGGRSCSKFKKEVCKYDFEGNFLCSYESIADAARCMGCAETPIANVCKGITIHSCGFIWRFKGDDFYKYPITKKKKEKKIDSHGYLTKQVNCYSLDDIFVCTYNSLEEAKNAVNLKNSYNITNVCQKRRNHAGGFKWFYVDDPDQPDKTKISN